MGEPVYWLARCIIDGLVLFLILHVEGWSLTCACLIRPLFRSCALVGGGCVGPGGFRSFVAAAGGQKHGSHHHCECCEFEFRSNHK